MKLFKEARGKATSYEPYKYVMQDTGSIYLGAKLTYDELLNNEMVAFKLKAVISQYILKEQDKETSLESAFYYMEDKGFLYEVFKELKARAKVMEKKGGGYKERIYTLKELTEEAPADKEKKGMVISEIIISKLALMGFTV